MSSDNGVLDLSTPHDKADTCENAILWWMLLTEANRRRANKNSDIVADKRSRIYIGPIREVNQFVDELRRGNDNKLVPYVDPDCGGIGARALFLFQDPGPKAAGAKGSGFLSISNNDSSAATMSDVLREVGLAYDQVMLWNAVPWFTGGKNRRADRIMGRAALAGLMAKMTHLQVVVTFGDFAANEWAIACREFPRLGGYLQRQTLHPSVLGLTRGSRQLAAVGLRRLISDVRSVSTSLVKG